MVKLLKENPFWSEKNQIIIFLIHEYFSSVIQMQYNTSKTQNGALSLTAHLNTVLCLIEIVDHSWRRAHLLNQPLQLVSELAEVAGGDESLPALLQTVTGQLNNLVVGKAEHTICQREDALRRVASDDVLNPFLHLSGGLREEGKVSVCQCLT